MISPLYSSKAYDPKLLRKGQPIDSPTKEKSKA